ncbi:hypothetical protein CDAR_16282 [Caerostris darwini]|uniref:Uncharacterized protein n=1 Tax=Caerostris darwini TaxID=1538125 RepID=A0AAV4WS81_9ARAC|nr:hypothetical protein CDAR_16282 [Caerostris darwini]
MKNRMLKIATKIKCLSNVLSALKKNLSKSNHLHLQIKASRMSKDNGNAVPVEPTDFIREEPIDFNPELSASADIVIKDEFLFCSDYNTDSSADEPPSTEPASQVTRGLLGYIGDTVPVVIKEQPISFDPGSSADIGPRSYWSKQESLETPALSNPQLDLGCLKTSAEQTCTSELKQQKHKNNVKHDWRNNAFVRRVSEQRNHQHNVKEAEYKAAETREQCQRRLQYINERIQRVRVTETPEQRQRRLEKLRTWRSKSRAAETEEQSKDRLENRRKLNARKKKVTQNRENVMLVEPTVIIKEEPIEFQLDHNNENHLHLKIKTSRDTVLVEPPVVKEEPITFDREPSADIVIKDEFGVCNEDYTGSSADVPLSTEPTSHVTLSVACLATDRVQSKKHSQSSVYPPIFIEPAEFF